MAGSGSRMSMTSAYPREVCDAMLLPAKNGEKTQIRSLTFRAIVSSSLAGTTKT